MILIDYTRRYYTDIVKTAVPSKITGKFVQLGSHDEFYLVISPAAFTKYHADIVEMFCRERGIAGSYDQEKKRFNISDRAWHVIGGGKFERDDEIKTIKFHDESMAYGKYETSGFAAMIAAHTEFSGYTIVME